MNSCYLPEKEAEISSRLHVDSHYQVAMEISNFNYGVVNRMPFRVAVGGEGEAAYFYGSHVDQRSDYADHTVGYASDLNESYLLLLRAAGQVEAMREEFEQEQEVGN